MNKNIYYVYVYLDPTKKGTYQYNENIFQYEPFYVGKGSNGRDRTHLKGKTHNKELTERISSIKNKGIDPIVIRIQEHLLNEDALLVEWKTIKSIGTLYNNTKGPLLNKSFTDVLSVSIFGDIKSKTYILEHPYVQCQEVIIGTTRFMKYCYNKKLDYAALINGKIVDGWKLDII